MLGHCLLTTLRGFNCRRPRSLLLHHHHHPTLSSSSSSSTQCPNPSMALPSPQNPTQRISSAAELKLIHRHCRAGQVATARYLFDEMPERNVVAYSTMIYGYATNGRFSQCARLFARMIERGVPPNSFTMVAVLVGAAGLGDASFAGSVHGRIVKGGLGSNPFVGTALLDSYAKCGRPMDSYALLNDTAGPSLVMCNAMIAGFAHNELFEEALLLSKKLWVFDLLPNSVTVITVVPACISYGLVALCESLHSYVIKIGLELDQSVMNSIFNMNLSFGNLKTAMMCFRKLEIVDVVTYTMMMGFLVELESPIEVLNMFVEMTTNRIEPDMVTMLNMVMACTLLGDASRGRLIHNQIIVRGFKSGVPIMNSLITMYSKFGDLNSSRTLFDCIEKKSLVSWTAIISCYVKNGKPIEGLQLLSKMRKEEDFVIDSVTMVGILMACSELANFDISKQFHAYTLKSGLSLYKSVQNSLVALYGKCGYVVLARRVFDGMISRDAVSWNSMILSYGLNGKGEEALLLFYDMEKYGEKPDSVTYLNTLMACSHSGLVDEGLIIFRKMIKEKGIKMRGEHVGCMVDMLARAGRLDDARELISAIQDDANLNALKALLRGCYLYGNINLVEDVGQKVLQTESSDFGNAVLVSNAYASFGKFEVVESLRSNLEKKGPTKNLGLSLLDSMAREVEVS
ncbi:Pentatricopeptide repeat-containing protein, chloroplastic [Ananas comosus]|uniref:Pentatricopeptide repeat-containing protein, chloroplastic n=1 Tax=Ananas comosus TaxID=4615 RepID=A0A199V9M4_ANACO|nr:Pentatricopeptide repeat-containing protein, chloroplastic [Ananas comosus]